MWRLAFRRSFNKGRITAFRYSSVPDNFILVYPSLTRRASTSPNERAIPTESVRPRRLKTFSVQPIPELPKKPQIADRSIPCINEAILNRYVKPLYTRGWGVGYSTIPEVLEANGQLLRYPHKVPRLTRIFQLRDIASAWQFMSDFGKIMSAEGHEAQLSLTSMGQVHMHTYTFDAIRKSQTGEQAVPGLTVLDVRLAILAEQLFFEWYVSKGIGRTINYVRSLECRPTSIRSLELPYLNWKLEARNLTPVTLSSWDAEPGVARPLPSFPEVSGDGPFGPIQPGDFSKYLEPLYAHKWGITYGNHHQIRDTGLMIAKHPAIRLTRKLMFPNLDLTFKFAGMIIDFAYPPGENRQNVHLAITIVRHQVHIFSYSEVASDLLSTYGVSLHDIRLALFIEENLHKFPGVSSAPSRSPQPKSRSELRAAFLHFRSLSEEPTTTTSLRRLLPIPEPPPPPQLLVEWIQDTDFQTYLKPLYTHGWCVTYAARPGIIQDGILVMYKHKTPRLSKAFRFKNAYSAMSFMYDLGNIVRREKHEPQIILDAQHHVVVNLYSFQEEGQDGPESGLSHLDIRFAILAEELLATLYQSRTNGRFATPNIHNLPESRSSIENSLAAWNFGTIEAPLSKMPAVSPQPISELPEIPLMDHVVPLSQEEFSTYVEPLYSRGWHINCAIEKDVTTPRLTKVVKFPSFDTALAFANEVARVKSPQLRNAVRIDVDNHQVHIQSYTGVLDPKKAHFLSLRDVYLAISAETILEQGYSDVAIVKTPFRLGLSQPLDIAEVHRTMDPLLKDAGSKMSSIEPTHSIGSQVNGVAILDVA